MTKLRWIALLGACALAVTAVACGDDDDDGDGDDEPTTAATQSTGETPSAGGEIDISGVEELSDGTLTFGSDIAYAPIEFFDEQNYYVTVNGQVDIRIDDGRHFLATTAERFDAITSDPLDPWVKGAAALYTREFWQLCKSRLNDGGVVTVFVQLYETTEDAVRSELATFVDVFPNAAVFATSGVSASACTTTPMRERPTNPRVSARSLPSRAMSSITAGGATTTSACAPDATRLRTSGAVANSTETRVPVARSKCAAMRDTPRFTAPALNILSSVPGIAAQA